jgi:hypothetical protein
MRTSSPGLVKIDGYSAVAQMIRETIDVEPGTVHEERRQTGRAESCASLSEACSNLGLQRISDPAPWWEPTIRKLLGRRRGRWRRQDRELLNPSHESVDADKAVEAAVWAGSRRKLDDLKTKLAANMAQPSPGLAEAEGGEQRGSDGRARRWYDRPATDRCRGEDGGYAGGDRSHDLSSNESVLSALCGGVAAGPFCRRDRESLILGRPELSSGVRDAPLSQECLACFVPTTHFRHLPDGKSPVLAIP